MASGLRIRNAGTRQIQIASGYRNLELVKSGQMNTSSFVGSGTIFGSRSPSGILSSTLGNDVLHVIRFVTASVSNVSGFALCQYNNSHHVVVAQNSPSKSLEYYTFGYASNEPSGPVGLRLRNPDGTAYYDSRRKGLRVLAAVSLPDTSVSPQHLGSFFPGTRIGLALANPRYYYQSPYPESCIMLSDAIHLDANNNIYVNRIQMWSQSRATSFTVGNTTMANFEATLLVIDLTEVPLGFG